MNPHKTGLITGIIMWLVMSAVWAGLSLVLMILVGPFGVIALFASPVLGFATFMSIRNDDKKKNEKFQQQVMMKVQTGLPLNPQEQLCYDEMKGVNKS